MNELMAWVCVICCAVVLFNLENILAKLGYSDNRMSSYGRKIVDINKKQTITNEQLDCAIIMLSDVKRGYNFTVISDYMLDIIVPALEELKEKRK